MKYSDINRNRAQNSFLNIYNCKTGLISQIAHFSEVIEAPNWSKDGNFLFFNSLGKIYRYRLSTGEIIQIPIKGADTCNNDHVLSPDGRFLAVSSGMQDDLTSRIYICDLASGDSSLVVPQSPSYLHGWSFDGSELAYCAMRPCIADRGAPGQKSVKDTVQESEEYDIYTRKIGSDSEIRLTTSPGLNDGPEYGPDGKTIWFNSVRTGRMQIWKMNVDGTSQQQMTFDHSMNSWFAHVSPDNSRVVYLAYHENDLAPDEHLPDKNVEIRQISTKGGEEKTLIKFFGGQGSINVNSWAPDSERFAFVSYAL